MVGGVYLELSFDVFGVLEDGAFFLAEGAWLDVPEFILLVGGSAGTVPRGAGGVS